MVEQLTVPEFRSICPANDSPTESESKQFKTDFIDPTFAALESECAGEDEVKALRAAIGRVKTAALMKYACKIVRLMVEDGDHAPPEDDGDMAKMEANLTKLFNEKFGLLSAQLQLAGYVNGAKVPAATTELEGDAEAKVLKVSGNGNCAYFVMEAGNVQSQDTSAKLDLTPEANDRMGKQARKTVCIEAHKVWKNDKQEFEGRYGPYQKFIETILEEKRDSTTWPEFCQWSFYANANRGRLEYRIKQLVETDGVTKVKTYSTRLENSAQPKFVVYPVFRKGHYDLAGVIRNGELRCVFPADEADAAEKLIDSLLSQAPRQVPWHTPLYPTSASTTTPTSPSILPPAR